MNPRISLLLTNITILFALSACAPSQAVDIEEKLGERVNRPRIQTRKESENTFPSGPIPQDKLLPAPVDNKPAFITDYPITNTKKPAKESDPQSQVIHTDELISPTPSSDTNLTPDEAQPPTSQIAPQEVSTENNNRITTVSEDTAVESAPESMTESPNLQDQEAPVIEAQDNVSPEPRLQSSHRLIHRMLSNMTKISWTKNFVCWSNTPQKPYHSFAAVGHFRSKPSQKVIYLEAPNGLLDFSHSNGPFSNEHPCSNRSNTLSERSASYDGDVLALAVAELGRIRKDSHSYTIALNTAGGNVELYDSYFKSIWNQATDNSIYTAYVGQGGLCASACHYIYSSPLSTKTIAYEDTTFLFHKGQVSTDGINFTPMSNYTTLKMFCSHDRMTNPLIEAIYNTDGFTTKGVSALSQSLMPYGYIDEIESRNGHLGEANSRRQIFWGNSITLPSPRRISENYCAMI